MKNFDFELCRGKVTEIINIKRDGVLVPSIEYKLHYLPDKNLSIVRFKVSQNDFHNNPHQLVTTFKRENNKTHYTNIMEKI